MGAKKRPFYRIVVADSRSPRDGRFIESLGYYDPITKPATVKVNAEKYHTWVKNGAQPSDSVAGVLKRSGALEAQPEAPAATAAPAPAPAVTPAPAAAEEVVAPVPVEEASAPAQSEPVEAGDAAE